MTDLQQLDGVGPARSDDLEAAGYPDVESLVGASSEAVAEEAGVPEDTALGFIVQAENIADNDDEDDEEESVNDTLDEDGSITLDENVTDVEDADDDSPERDDTDTELTLDLSAFKRDLVTAALLDKHVELSSRDPSRSRACRRVLRKHREGDTLLLTDDELNALYAAVRGKRVSYKGSNNVELMNEAVEVEEQVNEVR